MSKKNADVDVRPRHKDKQLEDYEPGATREQVFQALNKVATTPKSKKRDE